MSTVRRNATVVAAVAAASFSYPTLAGVTQLELHWQFYQGGYVQDPIDTWEVFQDHFDNLEHNTVSHTLGGATFQSTATMDVNIMDDPGFYQLSAFNELFVSASVDELSPQGAAHAFAALSMFIVRFAIDSPYVYTGSETLQDNHGAQFASGSVLEPGEYGFWHVSPFGPPLLETAFLGAGQSDEDMSSRLLLFEFTAIPTPAAAWLLAGLLLPVRRRREPGITGPARRHRSQ